MSAEHDITLHGGRVIDPASGTDEIADVAISGDRIAAIAPKLAEGRKSFRVEGRIVAPGFIDIHSHGHTLAADRMQAFDGITTTLECEVGSLPVSHWYDLMAGKRRALNYGAAASWVSARQHVMSNADMQPGLSIGRKFENNRWSEEPADEAEIERIVELTREGVRQGGLGIGVPNAYAPGSGVREMTRICEMAAEEGAATFTHVAFMSASDPRSAVEAYIRIIGYAGATGAHMHICHLNSTSGLDIEMSARILKHAQDAGLPITVEAYPYGASSTVVGAAFFTDPQYMKTHSYQMIQLVASGRRLTSKEDLLAEQERNPGQLVISHFLDVETDPKQSAMLDRSVLFPGGAIASDAMPWVMPDGEFYDGEDWPLPKEAVAHPRSSGTFTRFLRVWARERGAVSWPEAIEKCALIPAQILEKATPMAKAKGRLQEGMDADVVVFDPETIADRATFEDMNQHSTGMDMVIVNGVPLVSGGVLDTEAAPGRPVRGPVRDPAR